MTTPICSLLGFGRKGLAALVTFLTLVIAFAAPGFAQQEAAKGATISPAAASTADAATAGKPSEADMMKMMMEMGKMNEHHKFLNTMNGDWDYVTKFWMDGEAKGKAEESKGTATRKPVMGGRYIQMDVKGKIPMPGEDGKVKDVDFSGMGIDAYDNAKKKFVSTWLDSMGTGIMMTEGTCDEATKTCTYTGTYEMMPGMVEKVRQVMKAPDKDHMQFVMYEDRGGQEMKTLEINYTRKK